MVEDSQLHGTLCVHSRNDVIAYVEEGEVPPLNLHKVRQFLEVGKLLETVSSGISENQDSSDGCHSYSIQVEDYAKDGLPPHPAEDVNKRKAKAEKIRSMNLDESCLTEGEQDQFKEMMVDNMDAIAFSMEELGHCSWSPMKIRVDETQGVCHARSYKMSPQKMEIIDEQVRTLLRLGIIEPSESAWRSPLVVVTKKDGHSRLCTDFRVLNLLTENDTFPMPTARQLFLYMAYRKPVVFTAIDLLSGYHHCDLDEESTQPLSHQWECGSGHECLLE